MNVRITAIVLLSTAVGVIAQFETVYVRPNARGVPYEKTRQEIVNNYLTNKPLLNYVPVYTTEYGHWNGNNEGLEKPEAVKKLGPSFPIPSPKLGSDVDFQRLAEVITRLKTDMQELSHQTKHAYDDKLKELSEVKKLHEDLKIALQNTDELKNRLYDHERQLNELTKNIQDRSEHPGANPSGMEEFLNMIESLELMVRNISYKYGGKLGM